MKKVIGQGLVKPVVYSGNFKPVKVASATLTVINEIIILSAQFTFVIGGFWFLGKAL